MTGYPILTMVVVLGLTITILFTLFSYGMLRYLSMEEVPENHRDVRYEKDPEKRQRALERIAAQQHRDKMNVLMMSLGMGVFFAFLICLITVGENREEFMSEFSRLFS